MILIFRHRVKDFFGLVITEGKKAFHNRQNPIMYEVFKNIMGHKELWSSIDRYGIMRPTKNVPSGKLQPIAPRTEATDPSGTLISSDREEWKTTVLWLHWDLNPWLWTLTQDGKEYSWDEDFIQENNGSCNKGRPKLQGFLNFIDNRVGDGGFACIPGFNKVLKDYALRTRNTEYAKKNQSEFVFVPVPSNDAMQTQAQGISLRAGSLLIWSSELPHCNYPNNSNRFRIVQYVKMFEAQDQNPGITNRRREMNRMISKSGCEVTELGSRMLGLKDWEK